MCPPSGRKAATMAVDASKPPGTPAIARPTMTAVTGAIRQAAKTTGVSFDHLLATAKVESDLNPNLTMKSSTATGLFQFLEQTWLGVLKDRGGALGFGRQANAITQTSSGRYVVSDPAQRKEIMALRKDPTANAVMGGAVTQENAAALRKRIGRAPTDGELYVAHFFGPYAASKVINLASSNPDAKAAAMFPRAAAANRPIFYDKQGNARSVAGVYGELVRRYQVARASPTPGVATAATAASAAPAASVPLALAQNTAKPVDGSAASGEPSVIQSTETGPVFHSLFQTDARRSAVSDMVAQLWGTGAERPAGEEAAAAATARAAPLLRPSVSAATAPATTAAPLDLFRDTQPSVRGLFEGGA
jgi:hypothetical protein